MDTIDRIKQTLNPSLEIEGILFTMFDKRTSLSNQVVQEIRANFPNYVFNTVVPRNVRLSEAPSHGLPIVLYDAKSAGSDSYVELSRELILRCKARINASLAQNSQVQ